MCLGPGHFSNDCRETKSCPCLFNGRPKPVCPGCRMLSCPNNLFTSTTETDLLQDVLDNRCSLHKCCHHAADKCPLAHAWPPAFLESIFFDLGNTADSIKGGLAMNAGKLFLARVQEFHARCGRNRGGSGRREAGPTADVFGSPVSTSAAAWGSGSRSIVKRAANGGVAFDRCIAFDRCVAYDF